MKIKKLMTKDVGFCRPSDDLAAAVEVLRQRDCGAVPIVNKDQEPVGMLTDRDIALALADRDLKPSEVKIGELLKKKIVICAEGDRVEKALKKMRKYRVRRLPVVNKKKELAGILSISDLMIFKKTKKALRKKIYATLKAISRPRRIILQEIVGDKGRKGED